METKTWGGSTCWIWSISWHKDGEWLLGGDFHSCHGKRRFWKGEKITPNALGLFKTFFKRNFLCHVLHRIGSGTHDQWSYAPSSSTQVAHASYKCNLKQNTGRYHRSFLPCTLPSRQHVSCVFFLSSSRVYNGNSTIDQDANWAVLSVQELYSSLLPILVWNVRSAACIPNMEIIDFNSTRPTSKI